MSTFYSNYSNDKLALKTVVSGKNLKSFSQGNKTWI